MHDFTELVELSTNFNLKTLEGVEVQVVAELQSNAPTQSVKILQMIQMQKAIMAVGMFSIFESILQDQLACRDGFTELRAILQSRNEANLLRRFSQFANAINVLKHGRGRSYNALLAEVDDLPFRIKRSDERFFMEGDVSEISTLVEVDNDFVQGCANIIKAAHQVVNTP